MIVLVSQALAKEIHGLAYKSHDGRMWILWVYVYITRSKLDNFHACEYNGADSMMWYNLLTAIAILFQSFSFIITVSIKKNYWLILELKRKSSTEGIFGNSRSSICPFLYVLGWHDPCMSRLINVAHKIAGKHTSVLMFQISIRICKICSWHIPITCRLLSSIHFWKMEYEVAIH